MPADLVFFNGPVLTVDDRRPKARAVAVGGRRIVAVGEWENVAGEIGPQTRAVDLGGRALLPGFNDNHTLPLSFGQALGQIDASPAAVRSLAEIQATFRAAATAGSGEPGVRGDWLLARGYDD